VGLKPFWDGRGKRGEGQVSYRGKKRGKHVNCRKSPKWKKKENSQFRRKKGGIFSGKKKKKSFGLYENAQGEWGMTVKQEKAQKWEKKCSGGSD